jgi:hypothetical protein
MRRQRLRWEGLRWEGLRWEDLRWEDGEAGKRGGRERSEGKACDRGMTGDGHAPGGRDRRQQEAKGWPPRIAEAWERVVMACVAK